MKQLIKTGFIFILLCIFCNQAFADSAVKLFDTDGRPRGVSMTTDGELKMYNDQENITQIKTYYNDADQDGTPDNTTGSWQRLYLNAGESCKAVFIQVHDGDVTVYDVDSATYSFIFSSNRQAIQYSGQYGYTFPINVTSTTKGTLIGWVKAPSGKKLSVGIIN